MSFGLILEKCLVMRLNIRQILKILSISFMSCKILDPILSLLQMKKEGGNLMTLFRPPFIELFKKMFNFYLMKTQ